MKKFNNVIYFLSLLMLIMELSPSWGGEREDLKPGDPIKLSKSSGDLPRSANELPPTSPATKALTGPVTTNSAGSTSLASTPQNDPVTGLRQKVTELEAFIQSLQVLMEKNKEANAKEMKDLYDHIGSIIHNKPPIYKELIPTNKLLWLAMLYALIRCMSSSAAYYAKTDSYHFGLSMGVDAFLGGIVTGYYVCTLLGILGTRGTNFPNPTSTAKKKTD